MAIKTGAELAQAALNVAKNYKTIYVMGAIGMPMTEANKQRMYKHNEYNRRTNVWPKIQAATADTFGFDCVCLIKALLWGWCGDKTKAYGGATYASNGVPDIGADAMIKKCSEISSNFSEIEIGEAVWMSGHIGIYVGNGLAVESTPSGTNNVQITACNCTKSGYKTRNWTKHGKLPYVTYTGTIEKEEEANPESAYIILRQGASGDKVVKLQNLLNLLGYNCGTADGIYGGNTAKGVIAIQKKYKIDQDGIAGPDTFEAIKQEMESTKAVFKYSLIKNNKVLALQNILNDLGHKCGTADGKYGNNTAAGVKAYQKARSLSQDGCFGPQCFKALVSYLDNFKK